MKHRVKLTVIRSECRSGLHGEGEEYVIGEVCPPICHELWNNIYPMLYAAGCGEHSGAVSHDAVYLENAEARCRAAGGAE